MLSPTVIETASRINNSDKLAKVQSNPLKWIALIMSIHLGRVWSTYPYFIVYIVSKRDLADKWYPHKRVIHLSGIHLGRFDCITKTEIVNKLNVDDRVIILAHPKFNH